MEVMKKTIRPCVKNYARDTDGSTAVEFGMIALGFVALIMCIIETGRLFLTWNTFQFAVENATRVALADEDITQEELTALIEDNLEDFTVSSDNVDLDVTFPELNGVDFVQIEGTYSYDIIVPFLPESWNSIDLTANSRLPRPD